MKKKLFLILLSLFLGVVPSAFAADEATVLGAPITTNRIISVGISDNSFQRYYYAENTFYATDKLIIKEKNSGKTIKEIEADIPVRVVMKNNLFDIYIDNKLVEKEIQPPMTLSTTNSGLVGVYNLKRAGKPALYRGSFELVKPKCKENMFLTNNVLNLETYLRGVVPNEMPVRFGLEALKAQAVAARNYTIRPREIKYHEFDVCDSVACQVYFGANTESPLATRAVGETRGLVAQYKDEIILALYSSTAGGYTEEYESAFLPRKPEFHPYLSAVPDNAKIKPLDKDKDALEFYKSTPLTFDNESPYFRWKREWTKDELEKVLKENLPSAYKSGYSKPELKNPEDFGNLKEIKITKRGKSGKIVSMEIITDKNTFVVEKELTIRRLFKKDGKAMPSANMAFEQVQDEDGNLSLITVYGGGFGHGVGMSQFGAGAMSKNGASFDQILKHYYQGTTLATIPVELSNDPFKNSALFDFYASKRQGTLVVENKWSNLELKVVINGKEFKFKAQPRLSGKYRVDISQYLSNGDNKVYFFYPLDDNRGKAIKVFIELYGTENVE